MKITNLSDINPLQAFILNKHDLNNYVFLPKRIEIDSNKKYNTGMVLGCSNYEIMKHRVSCATKLYKEKTVNKLLLTGGIGYNSKNKNQSEACVMRSYMLNQGVNDNDIIVEDKSKNTYENMVNSIKLLEDLNQENIVLITSDFHSKRSKGILQQLTDLDIYSYGVLDGKYDMGKWDSSFSAQKLIRIEAFLLSIYQKKGIIKDRSITNIKIKKR